MDVPEDELAEEAEMLEVEDEIVKRLTKPQGRRSTLSGRELQLEMVEE